MNNLNKNTIANAISKAYDANESAASIARSAFGKKASAVHYVDLMNNWKENGGEREKGLLATARKTANNAVQIIASSKDAKESENLVAYIATIMPYFPAYVAGEGYAVIKFEESKTAESLAKKASRKPRPAGAGKSSANANAGKASAGKSSTGGTGEHLEAAALTEALASVQHWQARANELAAENAALKNGALEFQRIIDALEADLAAANVATRKATLRAESAEKALAKAKASQDKPAKPAKAARKRAA